MKELGEYLKRTRISNGVSLTEACEDLDFSTSHLENIESEEKIDAENRCICLLVRQ